MELGGVPDGFGSGLPGVGLGEGTANKDRTEHDHGERGVRPGLGIAGPRVDVTRMGHFEYSAEGQEIAQAGQVEQVQAASNDGPHQHHGRRNQGGHYRSVERGHPVG